MADRGSETGNEEMMPIVGYRPFRRASSRDREHYPRARSPCRPDQLLMDLSSLKVRPIEAMLLSPSSVVGLHPMFGGTISSFAGQTIVACPVRIIPCRVDPLRRLFENQGMRVKECTPEKHDHMMSIIQVLFHVTTMLTGRVLRETGSRCCRNHGIHKPQLSAGDESPRSDFCAKCRPLLRRLPK